MQVTNVKIYDLYESIIASGYPMRPELVEREIDEKDIERCKKLVKASEGFSGAEIEEVVNEALFNAYANGQKDLEMKNLLDCIAATSPLSRTMAETIANLRKWAEQRARLASTDAPEDVKDLGAEVPRLQQEYKNPFITKKKDV